MAGTDEDPWHRIAPPIRADLLSMRRVEVEGRWDFYWAKDSETRSLLVLRAAAASMPKARLPHLKGVDLLLQAPTEDSKAGLVVRLLDQSHRDIFLSLCLDIMNAAGAAVLEADAVSRAVARTWRWHHLLRGGRGLLSADEQIGLIGELTVLEKSLVPTVGALAAVDAWRGPLGETQDFCVGPICIEAKARGRTGASEVQISSEHQLDIPDSGALFLLVSVFEGAGSDDEPGATVTDVARRVRTLIETSDERALGRFDALLEAAGLDFHADYSAWSWREAEKSVFHVKEGFPRLVPGELPSCVSKVHYSLFLPGCAEYLVPSAALESALEEVAND